MNDCRSRDLNYAGRVATRDAPGWREMQTAYESGCGHRHRRKEGEYLLVVAVVEDIKQSRTLFTHHAVQLLRTRESSTTAAPVV